MLPSRLVVHDLRRPLHRQDIGAVTDRIRVTRQRLYRPRRRSASMLPRPADGLTWARRRTKTSAGPLRVGSGDLVARRKLAGRSAVGDQRAGAHGRVVGEGAGAGYCREGGRAHDHCGRGREVQGGRVGRAVADEDLVTDVLVQERQRRRTQDHLTARRLRPWPASTGGATVGMPGVTRAGTVWPSICRPGSPYPDQPATLASWSRR